MRRSSVIHLLAPVTAAALVAALTLAGSPGAVAQNRVSSSAKSDFYTPPSPLPTGRPGDLIRAERVADQMGAQGWRILYLSRDARNRPIAVSGTALVPRTGVGQSMPIIGFGMGTVGLGDSCAPSKSPLSIAVQAGDALKRGWALATTDYEGMGTPGTHTYVVGRSEGHAVIDAVRAVQRLRIGLSTANPVAFWGYSQGGGAAAWAGELQPSYAPELRVKAVVAGGVPADLRAVAAPLGGTPAFGVMPMAAIGFDAAYPELDLETYLNPLGSTLVAAAKKTCLAAIALSFIGMTVGTVTTSNPLDAPAWRVRLEENRLGAHPPSVPIMLYHGWPFDEAVDYHQAETLMREYCAAGARVTWHRYLGEHAIAAVAGLNDAQYFLRDAFAGRPAAPTC
jgi:secretory lipase